MKKQLKFLITVGYKLIIDEAIATLENCFAYKNIDELTHHSRPIAIAYIALKELTEKTEKGEEMGTYIVKEKRTPHYIRFGICLNCGSKIAREGERCEIENLLKIDCPVCGDRYSVPLGFMHNLNSKFVKRKLKRW